MRAFTALRLCKFAAVQVVAAHYQHLYCLGMGLLIGLSLSGTRLFFKPVFLDEVYTAVSGSSRNKSGSTLLVAHESAGIYKIERSIFAESKQYAEEQKCSKQEYR